MNQKIKVLTQKKNNHSCFLNAWKVPLWCGRVPEIMVLLTTGTHDCSPWIESLYTKPKTPRTTWLQSPFYIRMGQVAWVEHSLLCVCVESVWSPPIAQGVLSSLWLLGFTWVSPVVPIHCFHQGNNAILSLLIINSSQKFKLVYSLSFDVQTECGGLEVLVMVRRSSYMCRGG